MRTGGQLIVDALEANGVERIYSVPGESYLAVLDGFQGDPGRSTAVFTQHAGGAIGRVAPDACAFPHRYAQHSLMHAVGWKMGTDGAPHMAYARKYWASLEPLTSGFYINEVNDESKAVLDANYRENFPRMVAAKKQYDPSNLFRFHHAPLDQNVTNQQRPIP